jgi:hypothetical protein
MFGFVTESNISRSRVTHTAKMGGSSSVQLQDHEIQKIEEETGCKLIQNVVFHISDLLSILEYRMVV